MVDRFHIGRKLDICVFILDNCSIYTINFNIFKITFNLRIKRDEFVRIDYSQVCYIVILRLVDPDGVDELEHVSMGVGLAWE